MTIRLAVVGSLLETVLLILVLRPLALWNYPSPSLDLHIVTIIGGDWRGLAWYLATWGLLVGIYVAALFAARGPWARRDVYLAFVFAALFQATTLLAYPATSADIFHYIMEARIFFLHNANPLLMSPSAFPGDDFAGFASWPDSPAPYGPVWILLMGLPHILGVEKVIPMLVATKGLVVACALVATAFIFGIVRSHQPQLALRSVIMFGWSPLLILNIGMDGHNDAVMVAFLLAGVYFMVKGKPLVGLPLIMLAAAVKAPALLALPAAVLWQLRSQHPHSMRRTLAGLAIGAAAVLALYVPFWAGAGTFDSIRGEGGYFTASIATVLDRGLSRFTNPANAEVIANLFLRGGFLLVYALILLNCKGGPAALLRACSLSFFTYLALGAFWFMPWYAIWPLALAAASTEPRTVVPCLLLSITAMLSHAIFGFLAATLGVNASSTAIEVLAVLAIWPLPLASAVYLNVGRFTSMDLRWPRRLWTPAA
jgi:alpha-1,6-mannosyltransferase